MPKAISANEAKNRLGSYLAYVSEQDDEIIVESHGRPKAVIMSIAAFEEVQELREKQRRADLLDRFRTLREEVQSRNQELTEEQANELSVSFSREMIDDLVAEGNMSFERDMR